MLLTTPESRRWRRWTLAALVVLVGLYIWLSRGKEAHGGSGLGLTLGFASLALILLLLYYGVRKRRYKSTFGRMEVWLQSHVYLGLLSLVVVVLHSGLRFEDPLAVTALVVLAAVVVTGFVGAVLYTTVPRLLTEVESNLTVEEISERLNQIAASMARLAEGKSAPFRRIQKSVLKESIPGRFAGWKVVLSPGLGAKSRRGKGGGSPASPGWEALLSRVEAGEQEDLRRTLVLSRQHKELHQRLVYQQRYKNLLDAWLWLHLPLSLGLLVLVLAHAVAALFFRGLGGS